SARHEAHLQRRFAPHLARPRPEPRLRRTPEAARSPHDLRRLHQLQEAGRLRPPRGEAAWIAISAARAAALRSNAERTNRIAGAKTFHRWSRCPEETACAARASSASSKNVARQVLVLSQLAEALVDVLRVDGDAAGAVLAGIEGDFLEQLLE